MILPDGEDLLDGLTHQIIALAQLGDPESDGITYLQAQGVAQMCMPAINRDEYLQLREFVRAAKRGMGPCMREDLAEILDKLLDDVPVEKK